MPEGCLINAHVTCYQLVLLKLCQDAARIADVGHEQRAATQQSCNCRGTTQAVIKAWVLVQLSIDLHVGPNEGTVRRQDLQVGLQELGNLGTAYVQGFDRAFAS